MRRYRVNPRQRNRNAAWGASVRCYIALYGTPYAWKHWAVLRHAVNERNFAPLEELRRACRHAVHSILGPVPPGVEWASYNAFMERPSDVNPITGIYRSFLRGHGREEIDRRIREFVARPRKTPISINSNGRRGI